MGMMKKKLNEKINGNRFTDCCFLNSQQLNSLNNSSYSQLDRQDLEDKLFHLQEDNLVLKKEVNNTEHRLKFLTTKLSRLIIEKKRLLEREKTRKEIKLEEEIYDLNQKISRLEKENDRLKKKELLLLTKLNTSNPDLKKKNFSSYSCISSRTNSGLTHMNCRSSSANAKLTLGHRSSSLVSLNRVTFSTSSLPFQQAKPQNQKRFTPKTEVNSTKKFSNHLLKATREEVKRLEDIVLIQQQIIENCNLNKPKAQNEISFEDGELKTKLSDCEDGQHDIENEEPFDLEQKSLQIFDPSSVEKIMDYKEDKKVFRELNLFVDSLRTELLQAKIKNSQLEKQIISENLNLTKLNEMNQKILDLTKENDILRDSFQKCVRTCLSEIKTSEKEKNSMSESTKVRFEKLSNQLQVLKKEKHNLINDLNEEKEKFLSLTNDYNQLKINYEHLKSLNIKKMDQDEEESKNHFQLRFKKIQNERQNLFNQFTNVKQIVDLVEHNFVE